MNELDQKPQKLSALRVNLGVFLRVLGALIVVAVCYMGYQGVLKYRANQKAETQMQIEKQAEEDKANKMRDEELQALRDKLLVLENKPPEIRTVTVEAKDTVVSIVKEWSPRLAYLECTWSDVNGRVYAKATGSATIMTKDGELRAVTNKHVLLYDDQYGPRDCNINLPGAPVYNITNDFKTNFFVGVKTDWGFIKLDTNKTFAAVTKNPAKICASNGEVGDKLLILGYPTIGSTTGLTVTEGILSGEDGNYLITSAKIDKGNSGGAAILVKDDCYLGIPSASVVGSIESLGRILKAKFVIE